MRNKLLFVFCLIATVCMAQKERLLKGKVVADVKDLKGINVSNLSSGKGVVTENDGLFALYAKPGDTLLLTAVQLDEKQIVIEKEDFDYFPFVVKMKMKVTQLKEVVITQSNITAESLGLVPKGVKIYTPAERRYYTATSGPLDALVNAFNGKSKELEKGIEIEKYQMLQQKLETMFSEDYFVGELKIPSEQLKGFYVFAAENQQLVSVVKQKKKPLIQLELVQLASEYLKRLSGEK